MKRSIPVSMSRAPAISSSLRPSGVPDIDLPFGAPPPSLTHLNARDGSIPKDLRHRIRALANNANKVRRSAPVTAALCWHESGRLLHLHANRLAEAWICYSRAVAIYPDFKPSMTQLRRLSRGARAFDVMESLVAAEVERSEDPLEQAALLTDLAAVRIREGQLDRAKAILLDAMSKSPDALVPRLLHACIASGLTTTMDDMPTLSETADKWRDKRMSESFRFLLARLEERGGRLEEALTRLSDIDGDDALGIQVDWARLRLCLKLSRYTESVGIVESLIPRVGEPSLVVALSRLKAALLFFRGPSGQGRIVEDALVADHFSRFVTAIEQGNRAVAADMAMSLYQVAKSPGFRESLAISRMLHQWKPGTTSELSFGDIDTSTAACQATVSFVKMGAKKDERVPEIPAAALQRAMEGADWERAATVLRTMRDQTPDRDARWPLMVVESAIRLERLREGATSVLDEIVKASGRLSRKPLPTILRAYEKRHTKLADIAMSESGASEDKRFVALKFGWAAYHMAAMDPFESARLYTQSLDFDPALLFSIVGLARTSGTAGKDLVQLYLLARDGATDSAVRVRALLRAGIAYLEMGMGAEATPLLGEAAELLPEDELLGQLACRVSTSFPEHARPSYVKKLLRGRIPSHSSLMSIASLGLRITPAAASEWFERCLEAEGNDTLARRGNIEALIQAGQVSLISERLLASLRSADTTEKKASVYQRMAHLDRYYRKDEASAVLSLLALDELVPGHRSTLVRLAVYLLRKRRTGEIGRVLLSLSQTVDDPVDAVALTRASALSDAVNEQKRLLSLIAKQGKATVMELAILESRSESLPDRRHYLEQMTAELPETQVYVSRLADACGAMGDSEQAVALYKRSMESKTCVVYNLHAMAHQLRACQNQALLLDTLVIAADYWHTPEFKIAALLEAAQVARESLSDEQRAAELALHALSVDASNDEAFNLAESILTTSIDDKDMLLRLVESRLDCITSPLDRYELHLKARDALSGFEDDAAATQIETHLAEAMAIVAAGIDRQMNPTNGEEDTGPGDADFDILDFDARIASITDEHRYPHDSAIDGKLFTALGELYVQHPEAEEIARQYFERALSLNESDAVALGHLADIYHNNGDAEETVRLLGTLIPLMAVSREKLTRMLLLAKLHDEMGDEKEAERVLQDACQLMPSALEPLERLVKLYERQGDSQALGVYLTRALTHHRELIREQPDNVAIYRHLQAIAERKGEALLADIAFDMAGWLTEQPFEAPRAKWRFGLKVGSVWDEAYFYPEAVPIGLRSALKAIELPVAIQSGFVLEKLDNGENTKIRKRDPLFQVTTKLARAYGIKNFEVYVNPRSPLRVVPGDPVGIVFPAAVRGTSLEVRRFAAGCALQTLKCGLSLATWMTVQKLRRLLHGLVRRMDEQYVVEGVAERKIEAAAEVVGKLVSDTALTALTPALDPLKEALTRRDLGESLAEVGHRAGFLASGSALEAIEGLRIMTGASPGPLGSVHGVGALLSFAFSRDFVELTRLLSGK